MSSKLKLNPLCLLPLVITALLLSNCRTHKNGAPDALHTPEARYTLLQTELILAQRNDPYIVLNTAKKAFEIRLKGVLVISTPIVLAEGDSTLLNRFARRFTADGKTWMRPLTHKYLFASQDKTPDSLLVIVSEVLNVKKELLQREVPERFRLSWRDDFVIDIVTDISGESRELFKNKVAEARHVLRRPFGATQIVLKTPPDDALTLYRLTRPGTILLIVP